VSTTLTTFLETAEIPYELLEHERTETADAEADALGLSLEKVAKTVVLATDEGFVRVVLPASRRLDLHRLREHLGAPYLRLATEAELARTYPEFEVGAVPPLGGSRRDRVVVDRALAREGTLVFEAGAHDRSFRLWTADLVALADAELVNVSRVER
jgi:Ala-tRNA(Pro) deacylase